MPYDNANEVVNELFESLLLRYEIGLEIKRDSQRISKLNLLQINII